MNVKSINGPKKSAESPRSEGGEAVGVDEFFFGFLIFLDYGDIFC